MSPHPDFLHFFHRCEADLRAFIGSLVRDPHAAADLFQEVSRTLWVKFETYDLERPFPAWARGIAARKALEVRRKNARFPLTFPPETVFAIQDAFDAADTGMEAHAEALSHCLAALPQHSRDLLRRRYEDAEPCHQLARDTGISLKGMHQTLCRLRKALHACITRRLRNEDGPIRPAQNPDFTPAP